MYDWRDEGRARCNGRRRRDHREDAEGVRSGSRAPLHNFNCVDSPGQRKVARPETLEAWQSEDRRLMGVSTDRERGMSRSVTSVI